MNKTFFLLALLTALTITTSASKAFNFPASYEATYTVSRGGKTMAKQTTTYQSASPDQHTLSDFTEGTHGLASFTGFKRTETTHFEIDHDKVTAIEHNMLQKVAFKKKSYQFKSSANERTINGKSKRPFKLETHIKPISSHMLPLWLGVQVCQELTSFPQTISIPVLKSKQIKTYEFTVFDETDQLIRVERIYPEASVKSSQIWLNKYQNCLPVKTMHKEAGEPVIETKLLSHISIVKPENHASKKTP